jgi:hypothetical protein
MKFPEKTLVPNFIHIRSIVSEMSYADGRTLFNLYQFICGILARKTCKHVHISFVVLVWLAAGNVYLEKSQCEFKKVCYWKVLLKVLFTYCSYE